MAIAKYSSVVTWTVGSSPLTLTHNIGTGNSILVCVLHATNINSIQYAGVNMTLLEYYAGDGYHVSWYYLPTPTSGSNNVVITFASATYAVACSIAINGHNVASPKGVVASKNTTSSAANNCVMTVNGVSAGSWLFGGLNLDGAAGTQTAYGSEVSDGSHNSDPVGISFHLPVASAGNITTGYSVGATNSKDLLIIEIKEAVAVGPANLKTINGLAKASVKTINGLAVASVKTRNGLN